MPDKTVQTNLSFSTAEIDALLKKIEKSRDSVSDAAVSTDAISGEVSDAGFTSFDDYFKEEI